MARVYNRRDKDVPSDAVYVGRPSKWGNPYAISGSWTRTDVIRMFEGYAAMQYTLEDLDELRGKDLVCWCAPLPCHADVLLRLANRPDVVSHG